MLSPCQPPIDRWTRDVRKSDARICGNVYIRWGAMGGESGLSPHLSKRPQPRRGIIGETLSPPAAAHWLLDAEGTEERYASTIREIWGLNAANGTTNGAWGVGALQG